MSESIKNELISLHICQENKIKVVPLGLELDKFLDIQQRNANILNIGIIGRLVPIKNHRLFLEAVDKIIKDSPQIKLKFKIIGDGRLRSELEEYSHKLNINGKVVFLGWQNDLVSIYSDLDIVTLTSKNEGTPVSLIEAMASGKACVATDVGGVRDILGAEININTNQNTDFKVLQRGIIIEPGDSFGFAQALIFLLENNNLRNDMGMRGRDFVKTRFTKERLIKDTECLYNSILF